MLDRYEPASFEAKWRERWKQADLFRTRTEPDRPKFYGLDFFPYPSGAGLSVGHCRNYIPTDVLCRMKVMQGFNVLHPMGFDAFGLPAENEAIKTKSNPADMVRRYGARYRTQMELIGVSYDWSRSFFSSDPDYYRWTQWVFELLHKRGLAYRALAEVNWCPKDKTALANEEVVGGLCDRCGTPVEKRAIPQWFFKITDYAQRLIDDLDELDWPEGIKQMQRNWIGRSEGVEFDMKIVFDAPAPQPTGDDGSLEGFEVKSHERAPSFRVFTTRVDTVFGMTFCVLAPEHPMVAHIAARVGAAHRSEIEAYVARAKALTEQDRLAANREKTGVNTGAWAVNPANGKRVPIFIADYVLTGYGTGAIMAVPGHDQRDFEFAVKFGLDVVPVIEPDPTYLAEHRPGVPTEEAMAEYLADVKGFDPVWTSKEARLINSGGYSGKGVAEAQRELGEWMEALGIGERKVNYKLRDWLISRQRYWGCPIPVIHAADGEQQLVPEECLPVLLPDVEHYEPTGDGSSPLAAIDDFVRVTDLDGRLGRRETDTMGGFACSSWYFLRFCDPHNDEAAWSPEAVDYWMPVDCYVGGAEHAVMHLLYARFWNKVLYDAGLVPTKEPFQRLMNQGMLLAKTPYRKPREGETLHVGEEGILVRYDELDSLSEDELFYRWEKMSKSKGNVVTPEEAVERFGADALRVYELFVAPFEQTVQWTDEGAMGAVRFLSRVFRLAGDLRAHYLSDWKTRLGEDALATQVRRATHQLIGKASQDIEGFAFNTYVAALMTFVNTLNDLLKTAGDSSSEAVRAAFSEALEALILVLSPAAPHSGDELWEALGKEGFTFQASWPVYDPELAKADVVRVAVQVNGKLRDTLELPADAGQEAMETAALESPKVQAHLEGKTVRRVVVVPGKLVNVVAN